MDTTTLLDSYIKNLPFIISSGNLSLYGFLLSMSFVILFPKIYSYLHDILSKYITNKNLYGKKRYHIKHYILGYKDSTVINLLFSNLCEYFILFEKRNDIKYVKNIDYSIVSLHNSFREVKSHNIIIFEDIYTFNFKGHNLYFETKNIENKKDSYIIIYADKIEYIQDFINHVNEKLLEYHTNINYNQKNGIKVFESKSKKSDDTENIIWEEVKYPNIKTFDNIFLSKENEEQLHKKLDGFLDKKNEIKYKKFGMPRKLGIFLYGPPGTGKTSTVYAIAHKMKCNVHILTQDAFKNINTLQTLLKSATPDRALFLIEEVDTHKWAKQEESTQNDYSGLSSILSLSSEDSAESLDSNNKEKKKDSLGLNLDLNKEIKKDYIHSILDKAHASEYSIFVMTTNLKKEDLSPAIIRTGRCDISQLYDDKMTPYQVKNMIKRYTGFEINDAKVIDHLIKKYKIVDLNDKLFYDILRHPINNPEDLEKLLKEY